MYTARLTSDGGDALVGHMEAVFQNLANLRPVCEQIREVMIRENREARLAEVDRTNAPLIPLKDRKPSTIRKRGGDGPVMLPKNEESSLIRKFQVDINNPLPWTWFVVGSWPGMHYLKFHIDGTSHSAKLPIRNVVGMRDEADAEIFDITTRFFLGII